MVGKILFQKVPNPEYFKLTDATWDERFAVGGLIFCVASLGMAPLWVQDIIDDAVAPMVQHIMTAGAVLPAM